MAAHICEKLRCGCTFGTKFKAPELSIQHQRPMSTHARGGEGARHADGVPGFVFGPKKKGMIRFKSGQVIDAEIRVIDAEMHTKSV